MTIFDYWHENKPTPFNPAYKPHARQVQTNCVWEMESEGWYEDGKYTREERAIELRKRYEKAMKEYD